MQQPSSNQGRVTSQQQQIQQHPQQQYQGQLPASSTTGGGNHVEQISGMKQTDLRNNFNQQSIIISN